MEYERLAMRRRWGAAALAWTARKYALAGLSIVLAAPALAQPALIPVAAPPPAATAPQAPDVNDTTVGIVSGGVTGTYAQFAADLSNVLDSPGKLRILPVIGKGSLQNVEDILRVRGIDIGIVQSDTLAYIKKQGLFPGVQNRLQYITKLYNEELHLLARTDIASLEELNGKKVNFGLQGSGMAITSSLVFDLLKIKVQPVHDDPSVAIEKLKSGEIAATVGVYGKPAKIYDGIKPQDGIRFLPVPPSMELSQVYFPSMLTDRDYPNLVAPGETVETIAVGAVMVVFGWERDSWRYNKVARFVDAFFANLDQLQKAPRHQKWQEVNLGAKVPGWVRFPAADEWLKRMAAASVPTPTPRNPANAGAPASSRAAPGGGGEQDQGALLKQFGEWKKSRGQ
jgi:TRAP transporter TAXI family solute receptor